MSSTQFTTDTPNTKNPNASKFPINKPVFILAAPVYHQNLYKHIEKMHDWLAETRINSESRHYHKKINNEKEFNKLESLIKDLRLENSELFIDPEFHPKRLHQSLVEYLNDFLRYKAVNTQYTFTNFYRITVYPYNIHDFSSYPVSLDHDDERREYIIIPLLINIKKGKSHSQHRIVSVDPDSGEVLVQKPDRKCFYFERIEDEKEEEEEDQTRRKIDELT